MGGKRNVSRILVEKPEGKRRMDDLSLEEEL